MTDYTTRRRIMVDTQIRPSDVTKFPIIDAFLSISKEKFVPDGQREAAYVGENLKIGSSRVILEPRTLAKLLDALDINNKELVLDIGSGLGYSSAVISQIAEVVIAVEDDSGLARDAEEILSEVGADNVVVQVGKLEDGAPEHGPYDVIILQGGVEEIPASILKQLKNGGRVGAIFIEEGLGTAKIGFRLNDKVSWRYCFNAAAPVLSGFFKQKDFAL
ncbi:protein-L-isoaspartate O-methyltransferase [Paracoccaceae bacterium]|nr:protein-L-isoaspartate O-methyltransferase [Paracoccaceae bacterium]